MESSLQKIKEALFDLREAGPYCEEIVLHPRFQDTLDQVIKTIPPCPVPSDVIKGKDQWNRMFNIPFRFFEPMPDTWNYVFRMSDGSMEIYHTDGTYKKGILDVFDFSKDLLRAGNDLLRQRFLDRESHFSLPKYFWGGPGG